MIQPARTRDAVEGPTWPLDRPVLDPDDPSDRRILRLLSSDPEQADSISGVRLA